MNKQLILLTVISSFATVHLLVPSSHSVRISEPTNVNITDFPYQLSLLIDDEHACGGVIIGAKWALTAASCVIGVSKEKITLSAGGNTPSPWDGVKYAAISMVTHPNYDVLINDNDVAVIGVGVDFNFTLPGIATIEMRSVGSEVPKNSLAYVSGWGTIDAQGSALLQAATIPTTTNAACKAIYGESVITSNMICAGGMGKVDACLGDAGGPLVVGEKLTGIISYGYSCGEFYHPGVYTKISALREWIDQQIS